MVIDVWRYDFFFYPSKGLGFQNLKSYKRVKYRKNFTARTYHRHIDSLPTSSWYYECLICPEIVYVYTRKCVYLFIIHSLLKWTVVNSTHQSASFITVISWGLFHITIDGTNLKKCHTVFPWKNGSYFYKLMPLWMAIWLFSIFC